MASNDATSAREERDSPTAADVAADLRTFAGREHADPFDAVIASAATGEGLVPLDADNLATLLGIVGESMDAQRRAEAAAGSPPPLPTGVTLDDRGIWGYCPVQAEGRVDGLPFYFRARGDHWSLDIAATPDADAVAVGTPLPGEWERHRAGAIAAEAMARVPGWTHEEAWPGGPVAAGWMTAADATRCIIRAIERFRDRADSD